MPAKKPRKPREPAKTIILGFDLDKSGVIVPMSSFPDAEADRLAQIVVDVFEERKNSEPDDSGCKEIGQAG
ncbi:hypothetical protein [Sporomusa sp.]|uniref:hypothetical protein n=1 Tax=Sporomusa sp. TaxID=2078658 RepID=UPI002CB459CD|nr:hypothetical protein [Sporomusa sp.]HWR07790.1 hypothetical protein [Sporomusa sp.]